MLEMIRKESSSISGDQTYFGLLIQFDIIWNGHKELG